MSKEIEIFNKWFKQESDITPAMVLNAIKDGIDSASEQPSPPMRLREVIEEMEDQLSFCTPRATAYPTAGFKQQKLILEKYLPKLKAISGNCLEQIIQFDITDVDMPIFTHTKQFREHFDYIKSELVKKLKSLTDEPEIEKHLCEYCGAWTTQPDSECWNNPKNHKFAQGEDDIASEFHDANNEPEMIPTIAYILDKSDSIDIEGRKYYHRSVVINAMAEYTTSLEQEIIRLRNLVKTMNLPL